MKAKLEDQRYRQILFLSIRHDLKNAQVLPSRGRVERNQIEVLRFKTPEGNLSYWIKPSQTDSQKRMGLYRKMGTDDAIELFRGIHDIQVRYGYLEGLPGQVTYITGGQVLDWKNVVGLALRIHFDWDFSDQQYQPRNPSLRTLTWVRS